jgi:hypothetical protein
MLKHILDVVCHHIHGIMHCPSANTQFILTYLLQSNVPDTSGVSRGVVWGVKTPPEIPKF